jgi:hypothetical protein
MKRLFWIPLALFLMGQATPTATPTPSGPAMSTVTGNVVNADGSPFVNGVITFNSQKIQVIGGVPVNPTVVTTNTDTSGNLRAISLPQGLVVQVTVCPPATGQGQSSACSAPYSAFIPFSPTSNFGQLSQGTSLSPPNPPGTPPQLLGWNASNAVEAETLGGDLTLSRTGANAYSAAVLKVNGNTPGGTCTSPQVVNAIDSSGRPTCVAPASANLGGPYPDGATWTTTGIHSLTSMTLSGTPAGSSSVGINCGAGGSLQIGDASFWDCTELYAAKVAHIGAGSKLDSDTFSVWGTGKITGNLGIGQNSGSDPLDITDNVNAAAKIDIVNANTGTSAQAQVVASNGSAADIELGVAGTGFTGAGSTVPANGAYVGTGGAGGLSLVEWSNYPIKFWVNGAQVANYFSGLQIGAPTGGDKGAGTINVSGGFYINGVAVSGGGGGVTQITAGTGITLTPSPITGTGSVALTTPVSVANGGRGSSTAPTAGQIDVAQSGTAFAGVTMSGDATITSAGVLTVSKIAGITPGGTCTSPQFVQTISSSGVPTCATPAGGAALPSGNAGQFVGYPATGTTGEAETLGGDATLARTGANAYSITVTKTNGTSFTGLATATIPLSIANGGRGSSTAPSVGQIDVASSTTAFTPATMSGDCTITSTGAITCTKLNGVSGPFAPTASPTFSGTMTFPDGSTYDSTGHNSMARLGIGGAVGTAQYYIQATSANTSGTYVNIINTATTAAAKIRTANNLGHALSFGVTDSAYPAGGGELSDAQEMWADSTMTFLTTPSTGIFRFINNGGVASGQLILTVGGSGGGGGGLTVGAASGGDKGAGTINVATGIYLNGAVYTNPDYVFDTYYSRQNKKDPTYQGVLPLSEVESYIKKNHELPRVADPKNAELFHRSDIMLEKVEELTLYAIEQQKQIDGLKAEVEALRSRH